MTEEYVVQGKGGRGAVGKMGDCKGSGSAAVFMEEKEVAKSRRVCGLYKVWKDKSSAIQSYGSGNKEADFFCESGKASGRGARGCD